MLRVIILTLSILLGVFIVAVVVVGILTETGVIEDPDDAAPTTSTTETLPTEDELAAARQEILADVTEADCAEEAVWYGDFYEPMEADTLDAMLAHLEAGRFLEAEAAYWHLWTLTDVALNDYAWWMEICAPKSSPALVAEVEAFPRIVEDVRADLEEQCYEVQARIIAEDNLFLDEFGDLLAWRDCTPPWL